MRKIVSLILLLQLFGSCKINQTKNGLKTGKWITEETFFNTVSKSIGKYKKGEKKGTWNYSYKDRVTLTEKYKKDICFIIEYHNTGKIRATGQKKKYKDSIKSEWLPTGEWKFYDSEGVPLGTKIYDKGIPIQETYTE
ncbi:hypothetical protein [Flavobacterium agrisoli]|uniref:MORN repeat protein n=1 Tax=Flavobacterium agrisoli TaxID=2793066 RepID=A0A934PM35_9FLAO|nr:hypothetical protein [Flavobacterium agrisoli]MBK0370691.1 hypothetical protein [Flavobacterium agrisoli]